MMNKQKYDQYQFYSMPQDQNTTQKYQNIQENQLNIDNCQQWGDSSIINIKQHPQDVSQFIDFQEFIKNNPSSSKSMLNLNDPFKISNFSKIHKNKQPSKSTCDNISNQINQFICVVQFNKNNIVSQCCVTSLQLILSSINFKLLLSNISKIKVLYQNYQKCIYITYNQIIQKKQKQYKLKLSIQNDAKDRLYLLFSKIISYKLITLGHHINLEEKQDPKTDKFMMTGQINKLSRVLGQWGTRKFVLTDRIQSFKKQKCTFQIKSIKQIWTRFQIYQKGLIIKLRHGFQKTELSIPIVNYPIRYCKQNWLFRIYRLLSVVT